MSSNLPARSIGRTPAERKANVRKYSQRAAIDVALAVVLGVTNIFVSGVVGFCLSVIVIIAVVDAVVSGLRVRQIVNHRD